MIKYFIIYIILINIYALITMHNDKRKAQKGEWRTPEAKLFTIAVLLGSLGIFLGMYIFHHKTRHIKFVLGIPLILIIQTLVGIIISKQI